MPLDIWGIPLLYPSKPGGFYYTQSDDVQNDTAHFEADSTEVPTSGGGSFTFQTNGPTAFQLAKNSGIFNGNAIGGCNMDFTATESRGYAYKADDPRDIELKFIISFEEGGDNGLSISSTAGSHSSDGCCSGNAYMFNVQYNVNPAEFRFRKEMWHVDYTTDPVTGEANTHDDFDFKFMGHGNIGLAFVRYNIKDGVSSGHDSVKLEGWGCPDPDADIQNWIKILETEDKGGWGDSGSDCNGDDDQVSPWAAGKYRVKSNDDGGKYIVKHLSLREIDPNGSFDQTPDDPPDPGDEPPEPTTIQGTWSTQWDVNQLRSSPCAGSGGGGGGGGSTKFYTKSVASDTELSNSSTFLNRTAVGCYGTSASSVLVGKIIKQIDIPLKKVGSPTTPNITVTIYDASDNLVYTSPTTISPASLTTSYTTQTFDCSTNTVVMATNYAIEVDFDTTSDTDYVVTGYGSDSIANTRYYNWESGALSAFTTRDWACDMWQ